MEDDISFKVGDVIITGNRRTGVYRVETGDANYTVTLAYNPPNTLVRDANGDLQDTGVPLPLDLAITVEALKLISAFLDLASQIPGISATDAGLIEDLGDALSAAALGIQLGENLGSLRNTLHLAFETAWGSLGDAATAMVVAHMFAAGGMTITAESGPGSVMAAGASALTGAVLSQTLPTDDLATLSVDFIFMAGETVDLLERSMGRSFTELVRDGYNELLVNLYPGLSPHLRPQYATSGSTLKVESSVNVYEGSHAFNIASFAGVTSAVTLNLATSTAQNSGGAGIVQLYTIEGLIGTSYNDTLIGNSFDNQLQGGLGDDYLDGGAGFDFADYRSSGAGVTVSLALGTQNTGGAGTDTLINLEGIIGGLGNDTLTGNSDHNTLIGGGGSDHLYGGDGDDLLIGHGLTSGTGFSTETDWLDGGSGFDRVSYDDRTIGLADNTPVDLIIDLSVGASFTKHGLVQAWLTSIEGVWCGSGDDYVMGSSANNEVLGGSGADEIYGADGDDYIDGGFGNDAMSGGNGFDTLSFLSSTRGVTANLATGLATGQGNDTFSGFEAILGSLLADSLTGSTADNTLYGADGKDTVSGGDGNDLIVGGRHGDTLSGGSGADIFRYFAADESKSDDPDLIIDLGSGDVIDLSAIDANTASGGNQAFSLVWVFNGNAGQAVLGYDGGLNRTTLSMDLDGDGLADMTILLGGDQTAFGGYLW